MEPVLKPSMVYPQLKTQAGFGLVEVMIALVIISITAAGILASFIAAEHFVERSGRRITAFNFARQQLEQLKPAVRQDTFDSAALAITDANNNDCADDPGDWTGWQNLSGEFNSAWGGQSRNCISAATGSDYREATVQIKWRAAD